MRNNSTVLVSWSKVIISLGFLLTALRTQSDENAKWDLHLEHIAARDHPWTSIRCITARTQSQSTSSGISKDPAENVGTLFSLGTSAPTVSQSKTTCTFMMSYMRVFLLLKPLPLSNSPINHSHIQYRKAWTPHGVWHLFVQRSRVRKRWSVMKLCFLDEVIQGAALALGRHPLILRP